MICADLARTTFLIGCVTGGLVVLLLALGWAAVRR